MKKKPIIIAGPCSAETEVQVFETAKRIKELGGVDVFRAGIWKPRTRPNSFEGVGTLGLHWLKRVKDELGMITSTEVANAYHVKQCLEADVDQIWIGARTSANPFAMQEISDSLKGTGKVVYVKNPVNPDVNLWIGAIERLMKNGIEDVRAIHRGFSVNMNPNFRNDPMWHIPISLKREFPMIKLICDPSHIGGKRELIQSISQKSMDLLFDGLMIETHISPDIAWSDKAQQITPTELGIVLDSLIIRNEKVQKDSMGGLADLRIGISAIDDQLLSLLANRMKISKEIGALKKENQVSILQPSRWNEIKDAQTKKGIDLDLSEEFILSLMDSIHLESIKHQNKVMNE